MSDERRNYNPSNTGTVPKIKCRNMKTCILNGRGGRRICANNLATDIQHLNLAEHSAHPTNSFAMDATVEEQNFLSNPTLHTNLSVNGSVTPNTSSSASRKNSLGTIPKCENVKKFPNKKQIEDKLNQIREYLQITSTMMSNMKMVDDQLRESSFAQSIDQKEYEKLNQMIIDLRDSETKLVGILEHMETNESLQNTAKLVENGIDNLSEAGTSGSHRNEVIDGTSHEIDQQIAHLQQKAQNKLKQARVLQDKLMMAQYDLNSSSNQRDKEIDVALKEFEERNKRLNEPQASNLNLQDKLLAEVDSLNNQIINLHKANEDRSQLIQYLDTRDNELRTQHMELQNKLKELQNRKMQVDQLACQLHGMDEVENDDDVGTQVRRIVTMKDQLSKLKDMLEIVQTTEPILQNTNCSQEEQAIACEIYAKAENFLQKDLDKCNSPRLQVQNVGGSTLRYDNVNDKQVNRKSSERQTVFNGTKPRTVSNADKIALQTELEAKKRELEDLMGKHKAGTSNLNHDVGNDNKSEFSCGSNTLYDGVAAWTPMIPENRADSSENEECPEDPNEYSDVNNQYHQSLPLPQSYKYSSCNSEKCRSSRNSVDFNHYDHLPSRGADRSPRGSSVPNLANRRERTPIPNSENKNQIQKQLELIRSVCDWMLEQNKPPTSNVHQLRNNLSPSPHYNEPRFASPNPHPLNVIAEVPWVANNSQDCQNLLATNTLQTQAFMLNTLNQCCQMLWLQQRELAGLKQVVSQLQEKVDNNHYDNPSHLTSPLQLNPVEPRTSNRSKINQVSAACSMPNLNQYNIVHSGNVDPNYINNVQSARLLDSCLNNVTHSNPLSNDHINNSVLHGVNANINQMPSHLWNGQALNNQVAPGNRANNYWDNFRSYSRQNLLSTKSNDGLQNIASVERSNVLLERTNPFSLMSISKTNLDQGSINSSEENTPRRKVLSQRMPRFCGNRNRADIPPDVLNINHNKTNDAMELNQNNHNENDTNLNDQYFLNNAYGFNEMSSNNSNISEDFIVKVGTSENTIRKNEWHDDSRNEENLPKSKLFQELRENVYKEVATLISANEARPHFLIQLFRDLQMISSDPLRLKILQSIQSVIASSLMPSGSAGNQQAIIENPQQKNEQIPNDSISLQQTVWIKSTKSPTRNPMHSEEEKSEEMHNALKEIIPYLNSHEDQVIQQHFLINLKIMLIESESFRETVKDSVFQKHFSNVLDEVLTQYHGKIVHDVKLHLLQTINDLLHGELSFIQLLQETCPEKCDTNVENTVFNQVNGDLEANSIQMQNDDLAEADQDRVEDDVEEEEGAVGGFWPFLQNAEIESVNAGEVDMMTLEFQSEVESQTQFMRQGLDQVPTRLPTKSRSNTPNKD